MAAAKVRTLSDIEERIDRALHGYERTRPANIKSVQRVTAPPRKPQPNIKSVRVKTPVRLNTPSAGGDGFSPGAHPMPDLRSLAGLGFLVGDGWLVLPVQLPKPRKVRRAK